MVNFVDVHVFEEYYVMERSDGVFYFESNEGEELGYAVPNDAELLSLNLSIGYDLLEALERGWSFEGTYYLHDLGSRVCDECNNPMTAGHYNVDTEEYFCESCAEDLFGKDGIEELWHEHIETDYQGGMYWTQWTE